MTTAFYAGTSGFSYDAWRGPFYPRSTSKARMLSFYAGVLPAVELNGTFYRTPQPSTIARWREQVGDDFRFAVKAPRYLAWSRRLVDCAEPCRALHETLAPLGATLGCVFHHIPRWLSKDAAVLAGFLDAQPPGSRHAFEFVDDSWHDDEVRCLLAERDAALVVTDRDGEPEPPVPDGSSWAYVRLRRSVYSDEALGGWRERLSAYREAFVFFRHEDTAAGPALARRFLDAP